MVVGFATTYAISTYHHLRCEFKSLSGDTTLCEKVCQWLTTSRWFFSCTPVSTINKTDRHDITEILLKVALNTINSNSYRLCHKWPWICSVCRNYNPFLSSLMTFHWVCNKSNMTSATCGAGTVYPSETPGLTSGFSWS